jgi:transcriptional regulator with AAA-type ATPase domain
MQTSVLLFPGSGGGEPPAPQEVSFNSGRDLNEFRLGHPQAALVFPVEQLKALREFKDAVTDRGRKDPRKGLSGYLLSRDKIPLIDGNYSAAKKVKSGIRSLLESADRKGERNIYLIGVDANVFQTLCVEVLTPVAGRDKVRRPSRAFRISLTKDFAKETLFHLVGRYRIPPRMSKAYAGGARDVQLALQMAMAAAGSSGPVLILGETGTGKEIIAQEIHFCGPRAGRPLKVVNCAAIPTDLLESELFGHVRGAFTGALSDKEGALEQVRGGTLFLDEIGDMPLSHQAKILRAIDGKPFCRVGGSAEIRFAGRVVAATNRDLFSLVATNQFREDLYYRLRGLVLRTPALRSHPEDIRVIANHLWFNKVAGKKARPLSEKVLRELKNYPWQGNVRQLKAVLSQAFALFGEALRVEHIRVLWLSESDLSRTRQVAANAPAPPGPLWVDQLDHLKQLQDLINTIRENLSPLARRGLPEDSMVTAMRMSIQNRLDELPLLSHNQEKFRSSPLKSVESVLPGLTGSMKFMGIMLQKELEGARSRMRSLERELKGMEALIAKAADKLIRTI